MSFALVSEGPATSSHQQLLHVAAKFATPGLYQGGRLDQQWQRPRCNKQVGWELSWYDHNSTHVCCAVCMQLDMHGALLLFCLQGWLSHKDIQLAAYFPFFREAGIDEIEVRHTRFWHPMAVSHASRAETLRKYYNGPFIGKPLTTPLWCLPFVLLNPKPACGSHYALHSCKHNASSGSSALIAPSADYILLHASADISAFLVLWQDLDNLSIDAVQGYMLPWDMRRLAAALSNVLSPEQSSYGSFEPSLFCTARFIPPFTNGQQLSFCRLSCCLHGGSIAFDNSLGSVTALHDKT